MCPPPMAQASLEQSQGWLLMWAEEQEPQTHPEVPSDLCCLPGAGTSTAGRDAKELQQAATEQIFL